MEEKIYSLNPTPESFSEISAAILNGGTSFPEYESLQFFHEEIVSTILNWMGHGETGSINSLLTQLRKSIAEKSDRDSSLQQVPPEILFEAQLRSYCHLMAVFLRTSNAVKLSGLLAGKRNKERRKIFKWIVDHEKSFSKSEIEKTFGLKKSTAKATVDKFYELGLLVRQGNKYAISWRGRQYADQQDYAKSEGQVGEKKAAYLKETEVHSFKEDIASYLGSEVGDESGYAHNSGLPDSVLSFVKAVASEAVGELVTATLVASIEKVVQSNDESPHVSILPKSKQVIERRENLVVYSRKPWKFNPQNEFASSKPDPIQD